jgi:hypothetical protein
LPGDASFVRTPLRGFLRWFVSCIERLPQTRDEEVVIILVSKASNSDECAENKQRYQWNYRALQDRCLHQKNGEARGACVGIPTDPRTAANPGATLFLNKFSEEVDPKVISIPSCLVQLQPRVGNAPGDDTFHPERRAFRTDRLPEPSYTFAGGKDETKSIKAHSSRCSPVWE